MFKNLINNIKNFFKTEETDELKSLDNIIVDELNKLLNEVKELVFQSKIAAGHLKGTEHNSRSEILSDIANSVDDKLKNKKITDETYLSNDVKKAWDILKKEINNYPDFAWAVHCNIAMPICDAINVNHEQGNLATARLMEHLFDYNITKHENFEYKDITEEETNELLKLFEEIHPEVNDLETEKKEI